MTTFELLPEGGRAHVAGSHCLVWPVSSHESSMIRTDVDPWFQRFGKPSDASIDLSRLAVGAYLIDRLVARGSGFSRTMNLHVHVTDINPWGGLLNDVADILFWLTGDTWNLEVSNEDAERPTTGRAASAVEAVTLLSGGLDSFCGAALTELEKPQIFLGHWDNPIIKHYQDESWRWLKENISQDVSYSQILLAQKEKKKEGTNRSRSLLFMALAISLADASGARTVEVPENGFTSLNPPFGADRGGALSTRSTHPMTLQMVNSLLEGLGISIMLQDPYMQMTKGELLSRTADVYPGSFPNGAASTMSCGKLDGRLYRGGNPNYHCGLCVPCIVRRAAFISSGVPDATPYLSDHLHGDALEKLHRNRADDITAVRYAIAKGINDVDIIAIGQYPDGYDFDAAVDLCTRGLAELQEVPLP